MSNKASNNPSKKYSLIYESAKDLFFIHGIKRVSVDEICSSAGVSKMTFYKFFKNKNHIAEEIYNQMINRLYEDYRKIINNNSSFREKLKEILSIKSQMRSQAGSPFLRDIVESGNFSHLISKTIEDFTAENLNLLKSGQDSGEFRKSINPEFFLYLIEHAVTMVKDEALIKIFPDTVTRMEQITDFVIYGIF